MIGAHELKLFLEVARTLNVTRASERLGLSQPALSQALQRMERDVGRTLFQRSKKGLKLTLTGQRLLERAPTLLLEWEKLFRALSEDEEKVSGQFRFGCHPSVGLYTLTNFLPVLQRRYPEIDLQLRHGHSRHIAEDIISERLDLGIVVNPPKHPDLVVMELARDEVGLWTATKGKVPEVLIWDPDMLQAQWIAKELEKKGRFFRKKIESANLEVIRQLTVEGCGIGILPGRVATALPGPLRHLNDGVPPFKDRICLVHRVDTEKSAAFRALVQVIKAEALR